eukprot:gnl/TRDRNA2_/TRDRNA2_128694_c1_seq1.p1 gnl/TRDRNA2_/TRDRNA2_128694_c1~~gnl/TRDRNA2_/TRDRNA2_128694_c1_seq1.p1  ORF type:complete len:199 (+),score=20.35 gnl/TRDRNA2_/TRDRNA2_128694_c1_seq1:32-628(+)
MIGRHRGKTFADVRASDPGYVSWALRLPSPSGDLERFVEFLKAEGLNGGATAAVPLSTVSSLPTGDTVLAVGRHRGRTFADVKANDSGYVAWVLSQPEPSAHLQTFVEYLRAEESIGGLPLTDQARYPPASVHGHPPNMTLPRVGGTVLTFGRHRGRTFADVKANETGYVSWALSQPAPSAHLQAFVEYLKTGLASPS